MSDYPGINMTKFKGFAVKNLSGKDICIVTESDAFFPKEFILKPRQVFYPHVSEVIKIMPIIWAKKSKIPYLEET